MRFVPAGVLAGALLLALGGCGGSVADRDRPSPTRQQPSTASPFCAAVQAGNAAAAPLGARGGIVPEELSNTVEAVRRSNVTLLNTAPPEIRNDVDTYVRIVDLQLDALLASGGDAATLQDDPALEAQINAPDAVAANERVRDYVTQNCSAAAG
ncbi:hypothetical protein [Pseudonocardia sp.]|uniref:hypothetical protein n=1 Tax=Pseudonocardia sp. TaxID=60912 RepID=UPI0026340A6A|nr:hypothetical protein [Pseudonocardia sp.]